MRLALTAALILLFANVALAATFVPSSAKLRASMLPQPLEKSKWSHSLNYAFGSDYADRRTPRAYDHALVGNIEYQINSHWTLGLSAGLLFQTVAGQIPKEEQQTYSETVNPSTELAIGYGETTSFGLYSVGVHGEPLWTDDNRQEGHQGLIGASGDIKINFFNKRYSMTHLLDGTSLINSFHYNSEGDANPDYFWTYKWRNEVRFLRTWKASYTFGAKLTRYLDGFVGYNYNNTIGISKTWNDLTTTATYDNGGFTDDGYVRLWYIDQYRRVAKLKFAYSF